MRATRLGTFPRCSHCGEAHDARVYADTGAPFDCWEHFGAENRAIMDLLDITWGYSVVEDAMRLLPQDRGHRPYRYDLIRTIEQFSQRPPEEIRRVLEEISDAVARAKRWEP